MPSIVTLTLSPCIDKSTSVDKFIAEKKLKCTWPKYEPGGGGINVSRALKRFNVDSTCVYVSGGHTGKFLDELLLKENMNSFPVISLENSRENFIVFENSTNLQFRFGMPTNKVKASEWKHILKFLSSLSEIDYLVLSGSINSEIDETFFDELSDIVSKKKCKLIADTAGKPLQKVIAGGAFLIKPNQNEYSGLFGNKELGIKEIIETGNTILSNNRMENIIVSLGSKGALLISSKKSVLYAPPSVNVKSTVGAGDSMISGIIYSLINNKSIYESVKYGVACGTATTLNSGTELFKIADAEKLLNQIKETVL